MLFVDQMYNVYHGLEIYFCSHLPHSIWVNTQREQISRTNEFCIYKTTTIKPPSYFTVNLVLFVNLFSRISLILAVQFWIIYYTKKNQLRIVVIR